MINDKLLKGATAAADPLYDIEASNTSSYSGSGTSITNVGTTTGLTTTLQNDIFQVSPYKGNWHFETTSDKITLPTTAQIFTSTPTKVTLEVWVRFENANYQQSIISNTDGGAFDGEYSLGMLSLQTSTWENYIFYQMGQSSTTGYIQAQNTTRIQPGVWNHIVITHDFTQSTNANILKMYLNGVAQTVNIVNQAGTIDATAFNSSKVHWAGKRNVSSGDQYLMGNIAQIRMYDTLLDDAAVLDRYDATKALYYHEIDRSYTNTGITSSINPALLSHFKLDNNGTDAEGTENLTTQPSGYNAVEFSDKFNLYNTYAAGMYGRAEQVTTASKQGTIMQFSGQYNGKTLPMAVSMWFQAGSTQHSAHAQYQDLKLISFVNGNTLSASIAGRNRAYTLTSTSTSGTVSVPYEGKVFINTTGGSGDFPSNSVVNTGEWTHLVINYNSNGNTTSVYINGQLDNSVTNFNPGSRTYDEGFGGEDNNFNDNHQFFNGMFDNIRIYNRVLTSSEVISLYTEGANVASAVDTGEMSFLVVAGGGGGGACIKAQGAAGGGAGGYRTSHGTQSGGGSSAESKISLSSGTYTITVGAGGTYSSSATSAGSNGSNSSIAKSGMTTITSTGGGGGASSNAPAGSGGSGGGGHNSQNHGSGTANQGFDGGTGSLRGGNGGGANKTGTNSNSDTADGLENNITGGLKYYAGGGGGGGSVSLSGTDIGPPSKGGGGQGMRYDRDYSGSTAYANTLNTTGKANTGGGGGGAGGDNRNAWTMLGGSGGSGVVVLRLKTSEYSGSTSGSPAVYNLGDDTVLVYTSSGNYYH